MNIYKYQYIIIYSSIKYNIPKNFIITNIGMLDVYYEFNLNITKIEKGQIEILLLGFILDPFHPNLSNLEILDNLCTEYGKNTNTFLAELQKYSGRYVIIYKNSKDFIVTNDCYGQRQIYYNSEAPLIMSSSPELIAKALNYNTIVDKPLERLIKSKTFHEKEYAWYGDRWYDLRIRKVLPNNYFDLKDLSIHRINYFYRGPVKYENIIEYAKIILSGSIEAIHNRYENVLQPITAGWDSRILLAASKKLSRKTNYYQFKNNDKVSADELVAKRLSNKLNVQFHLLNPGPLKDEFIDVLNLKHFYPRMVDFTSHHQWHYYNSRKKNTIIIKGNGGEIVRCHYLGRNRDATVRELLRYTRYKNDMVKNEIIKWMSQVKEFSSNSGIGILDLFYWEQRMGNWGALYPYEQDIATEEFHPFNNKNLLYAIFKIPVPMREFPHYFFFRDLISQQWPETLSEPINPILGFSPIRRLKNFMKSLPVVVSIFRRIAW